MLMHIIENTEDPQHFHLITSQPDGQIFTEPHKIQFILDEGHRYYLGIDPSSNKVGITISDLDFPIDNYFIWCERESSDDVGYMDGNLFIDELCIFLDNLVSTCNAPILAAQIELMFYNRKKDRFANASLLKSAQTRLESYLKRNGVTTFTVNPQLWKRPYLSVHPQAYMLNYSEANKEAIRYVGEKMYPYLQYLPKKEQDLFDSIGISHYFREVNASYFLKNNLVITKSLDNKYKKKFFSYIFPYTDEAGLKQFLDRLIGKAAAEGRIVKPCTFTYCKDLTIDENFKAALCVDDKRLYLSIIQVEPKMLSEFLQHRDTIGNITPNTKIVLCCFEQHLI